METQRGHYNPRAWDRPWILQRQRLDDLVTIVLSVLSIEAASSWRPLCWFYHQFGMWPESPRSENASGFLLKELGVTRYRIQKFGRWPLNPMSSKEPRGFGADDKPVCPSCGKPMHLIRRGPHPKWAKYEIQIFRCKSCNHEETRSVDVYGELA